MAGFTADIVTQKEKDDGKHMLSRPVTSGRNALPFVEIYRTSSESLVASGHTG